MDPFNIGRTVDFEFSGNSQAAVTYYGDQEFSDQAEFLASKFVPFATAALTLAADVPSFLFNLFTDGHTAFRDELGRPVVYGTVGKDVFDEHSADASSYLAADATNGLVLIGGPGGDRFSETDASDRILGGAGDDQVYAGLGSDSYDGGADKDLASYGEFTQPVSVTFSANASTGWQANVTDIYGSVDTLLNFEQIFLTTGADTLTITDGSILAAIGDLTVNALFGLGPAGDDTLSFQGSAAGVVVPSGVKFHGFENVIGSDYDDGLLLPDPGHNHMRGGLGNDTMFGGAGADRLEGEGGDDILNGGEGADVLVYSEGSDTIEGGAGNDYYDFTGATGAGATVVFNPGDGHDVLENSAGHMSKLVFEGISSTDIKLTYDFVVTFTQAVPGGYTGNFTEGDLLFTYVPTGETIFIGGVLAYYEYKNSTGVIDLGNIGGFSLQFDDRTVGNNWVFAFGGPAAVFQSTSILPSLDTALADHEQELGQEPDYSTIPGGLDGLGGLVEGGDDDDNLTGSGHKDTLVGGAGADTMAGSDESDTYYVDSADDTVIEAAGAAAGLDDTIFAMVSYTIAANVEHLTLQGNADVDATGRGDQDDKLTGNSGANTLDGAGGSDTLLGGLGDDVYVTDGGDTITEAAHAGIDTVKSSVSFVLSANLENLTLTGAAPINGGGNALDNIIIGNSAANTLNGDAGADTLIGGAGDDVYLTDGGDTITEQADEGADTVQSSGTVTLGSNLENLVLTGAGAIDGAGNDLDNLITGNSGDNELSGGGGDDILEGGGGSDTLVGGAGNDTYIIDAGDTITELAGEGVDTVLSSTTAALGDHLENLTLTGSAAIDGGGNALDNVITGNSGANALDGGGGSDTLVGGLGDDVYITDGDDTIIELAGEGTDTVQSSGSLTLGANLENLTLTGAAAINGTGNSLENILIGNSGANTLDGSTGSDTLIGGTGNDVYVVDDVTDVVTELVSEGSDRIESSVSYTLSTDVESLVLTGTAAINGTGNALANVITGNGAANRLDGGAGADAMSGGAGDDTYVVDTGTDVVTELASAGTDTVESSVSFALSANVENLVLTGVAALNGTGNALANVITGNTANNTLDGGTGGDLLIGGAGNDIYITDGGDTITELAGEGTDTVQSSASLTLVPTLRTSPSRARHRSMP